MPPHEAIKALDDDECRDQLAKALGEVERLRGEGCTPSHHSCRCGSISTPRTDSETKAAQYADLAQEWTDRCNDEGLRAAAAEAERDALRATAIACAQAHDIEHEDCENLHKEIDALRAELAAEKALHCATIAQRTEWADRATKAEAELAARGEPVAQAEWQGTVLPGVYRPVVHFKPGVKPETWLPKGRVGPFPLYAAPPPAAAKAPDATWRIDVLNGCPRLWCGDDDAVVTVKPEPLCRLLAGRSSVKLAVSVIAEEEGK